MRRWRKALAATGVALAVLVPSGVALAATTGPGSSTAAVTATCNGDHQMLRLRDGTGYRHTVTQTSTVQPGSGQGQQHRSGPQDGSGPHANRALDGTGNQWGRAR